MKFVSSSPGTRITYTERAFVCHIFNGEINQATNHHYLGH
jgi:hypothetical protein